MLKQM